MGSAEPRNHTSYFVFRTSQRMRFRLTALLSLHLALMGCASAFDVFDDIGSNLASPSAMVVDVSSNRLYLVNSNSEVLYDWRQGSFHVLDITDPLAPVLINYILTDSFSGEIYLDLNQKLAYVPNRYSEDITRTEDRLYTINIDEASAEFLSLSETPLGRDPFGIACCHPQGRAWITTSDDQLQYVELGGDLTPGSMPLTTLLDNGASITSADADHVALKDGLAFLTRVNGGVMVMNLDEAGVANAVPMDYFISDIPNPRGIVIRGDWAYIVGEGKEGGSWKRFLLILNISSLTPLFDNTTTRNLDKEDDGLLVVLIEVGKDPQEVALSSDYAFVTNMDDDTVSVISLASLAKITDIAMGQGPFSLALYTDANGQDRYMYVGNVESNTISIIDISTLAVVATYP